MKTFITSPSTLMAMAALMAMFTVPTVATAQTGTEPQPTEQRAVGEAVEASSLGLDSEALARMAAATTTAKVAPPKSLVLAPSANSTMLDLLNGRLNYLSAYTAQVYPLNYRGKLGAWWVYQEKSVWGWTWMVNAKGVIYARTTGPKPVLFKFADGLLLKITSN